MQRDLPSPTEILEELADKVVSQIDRSAPVAFERALAEMTRYHRFLLAVNASRSTDGAPFSYAEVEGDAWRAPHRAWIQQYGRLFERAADRIPDDDQFVQRLAHVALALLPGPDDPELPPGVIQGIVDLGPTLAHRLEAWRTKRTTVETAVDDAAAPRLLLSGSDAKAFANVMSRVVGAWETQLSIAPNTYQWPKPDRAPDAVRWTAFQASWPFIWRHLQNTAYCLAVAVWNEDETGAALWREALVRWPSTFDYILDGRAELKRRRLLYPDILQQPWNDALTRAGPFLYDYMPPPTPEALFSSIIHGAHGDAMALTASLLTFWTINQKQSSDIGARTAGALLRREFAERDDAPLRPAEPLSLRGLFFDLLRLRMSGERYEQGSYGQQLDRFVAELDNMTERRVVPGRVYTPSTLHERDDLAGAHAAMLAGAMPTEGDGGLGERVAVLAAEEDLLPEGDRSLRSIRDELQDYGRMLDAPSPGLARGIIALGNGVDPDRSIQGLREILAQAVATIEAARSARLRERPIDPARFEQLRRTIETAVLSEPAEVRFFEGVAIERTALGEPAPVKSVPIPALAKAQFIEPPMDIPTSGLEEFIARTVRSGAGEQAWRDFLGRPRETVAVRAPVEDPAFWSEIANLVARVGPAPLLIVSRAAEGRALQHLVYGRNPASPALRLRQNPRAVDGGTYITTVNDVEVFSGDLSPGTAWLFSGRALRAIAYEPIDEAGRRVATAYEPPDALNGTFRASFRQSTRWNDWPAFELRISSPAEREV